MLRVVSIGVIAWMLWESLDHGRKEFVVGAHTDALSNGLKKWSKSGVAADRISVQLDSVPTPRQRDWLAALRASGSKVSWNGSLPAVGVEVQPIAAPSGGYNVLVSAPAGSSVVVGDEVGPLDTIRAGNGGARVSVPSASGVVTATSSGTTARVTLPASLRIKRVLVLGSADWESKFVIAALEEDGWKVDAQTSIAPGVRITQGSIEPIDTSRYSAVIALDKSASSFASEITRYALSGGGVILGASAAGVESFSVLRAGGAGRIDAPSSIQSEPGSATLQSLSVTPIVGIRGDAVVLDRRNGNVAAAARRVSSGRVTQLGYLDTWRWRMSGSENSVSDHRKWWTNVVAGVAYAPPASRTTRATADDAPVARLVGALGPPSSAVRIPLASTAASVSLWWLFAILSLSLLAEWVSRRTRGVR
ncbi:MAG: hypothetical protein ABJC63_16465 [Gemmatimonadales bacterium]